MAAGEHLRQQAEIHVIIGHLVHDPLGPAFGPGVELGQVLLSQPAQGRRVQVGNAVVRRHR